MNKTARFINRERALARLFTTINLVDVWRDVVKEQMRGLHIIDLHDYYDFNLNVEERAKEIRNQILKAQYKASNPLTYKLEKNYGVCRHLMIPSPSDALVFQTITEYLTPLFEKVQPTKKAYYSRDRHTLKLPHQLQVSKYPWQYLWPKFQKDIWQFTDECDFLAITDIANFFDNIGLRELRHIISSRIKVNEVILDLLFNIIEQLSWSPDYLPTSLKGLPTINIEAFRLLPHVMLFEVDEVINKLSHGNFVRWMDDINIGVDSKEEAYTILGSLNDVLKSRGLALNLAKTAIYSSSEAKIHFMFDENTYLDQISSLDPASPDFAARRVDFLKHFENHIKNHDLQNWDKVTKRYFTIASKFRILGLRKYTYNLFMNYPSVRSHILSYFGSLGFSKMVVRLILSLLKAVKRYDDVTLFEFCKLITDMEIPRTDSGLEFIRLVDKILKYPRTDFDLYCYLWFLAKYGESHILINLILGKKQQWRNEQFLARQVVSVLPRLIGFKEKFVYDLVNEQITMGPRDAASVASNIHLILSLESLGYVNQYLFPPKVQKPYPLSKYLILSTVLASKQLKAGYKDKIIAKTKLYVSDPWYLHWLKRYKLI